MRAEQAIGGAMCLLVSLGFSGVAYLISPHAEDELSIFAKFEFVWCDVEKASIDTTTKTVELELSYLDKTETRQKITRSIPEPDCNQISHCLVLAQISPTKNACLLDPSANPPHVTVVHDPAIPFQDRNLFAKFENFELGATLSWIRAFQGMMALTGPLCGVFGGLLLIASVGGKDLTHAFSSLSCDTNSLDLSMNKLV
eukprot:c2028_g1_i1.p1 GENE.c2028_g1_i1~~c2028_g1_i1.p1  ORF type:complete len:199 (-),score=34.88 c2028_g1_i1:106-702(-)